MKNCKLAVLLFIFLWVVIVVPCAHASSYEDSLKAYWKLDETSGNPQDSAGGHNVTSVVGNPVLGQSGNFGNSVSFDGTGDYLSVPDSTDWDILGADFTWSINFKADSINRYSTLMGQEWRLNDGSMGLVIDQRVDNTIGFYAVNTSGAHYYGRELTGGTIAEDEWHSVSVVKDDSRVSLYFDGTEVDFVTSTVGTFQNYYDDMQIGGHGRHKYSDIVDVFDGYIDDIAIWHRALDVYELDAIYNVGVETFQRLLLGAENLGLGMSTEELAILTKLYADGKEGIDPGTVKIGNDCWHYISGDLPGDIGGTTYEIGDSWVYGGKYYIKLGSGVGTVPELPPFSMQFLTVMFGGVGMWMRTKFRG